MTEVAYNSSEQFGSWDSVPDEYVPPAESIYRGTITEATRSSSKKDGKPMVVLTVKGEFDMVAAEDAKLTSRYNRVMITQGEGGFRLKQLVKSAEVDFPESPRPDDVDDFANGLVGKQIHFRTKNVKSKTGSIFVEVARFLTDEQAQEAASNFGSSDEE